jgi:predicted nucleic acid-binding protein
MTRTAYLDTTVFVEIGTKRGQNRAKIRKLLEELKKDRVRIYTSMITVQELAVATFRSGTAAKDVYGDIANFARVYGVTKEIALTAAKNEAALKDLADRELERRDPRKPETEDQKLERLCENRRRKWDCFHIATAQQIGCVEFYSTDKKLQKRPEQLGIKSFRIVGPDSSPKTIRGALVDGAGKLEVT